MKQVFKFKAHKILTTVALLGAASIANAVPITGTFGVYGAYSLANGTDLGDTTSLNLLDVIGGPAGTGDMSNVLAVLSSGTAFNTLDFPGIAVNNLFRIEGWQVDFDNTTQIFEQNANTLTISGNGIISCYDTALCGRSDYEPTLIDWNLSAQSNGSSYSIIVGNAAVVPVPAAVWLFGSGLLGLASVVRRRSK